MQTIKLDISAKNNVQKVYAKQRDVGSKFIVEFFENGVPYEIDDEAIWSVWYSGASGDGNYIAIGDHVAVIAYRSVATVEMIMQMLDKPGDHEMCLVMYDKEGGQKGYWNIPYYVEAVPGADSKGATEYYQAFLEAQEKAEEAAERAEDAADRAEAGVGASIIVAVDEGNVATHNAAEIYDAIENKQTVVYRHDDRLGSEFISLKTATPDVAVFSKTGYPTEFDIFNIEIDSNGTVNYQTSSGSTLVQQAVEKVETDTAPVSYLPQDPTPEQQAHARKNVAALAEEAVCVSYEQPTDPEARVWVNPNGAVGNTEKKTETNSTTTVASIVGLALNEILNNTAARYATIQDAHDGASATADGKVLAYTCGGALNIMLLDNMESASVINITKDCTLHLNGKTLSFTAPGAYLNINTASEVTINGKVAGSEITMNITNGANEKLVSTTGTTLNMVGGTYSAYGTYATAIAPIRTESAETKVAMSGCVVDVEASAGTTVRGAQFKGDTIIDRCSFNVTSHAGSAYAVYPTSSSPSVKVTNSKIAAKSDGTGYQVVGIHSYANNLTVENCHIEADGFGDCVAEDGSIQTRVVNAIVSSTEGGGLVINGGYYWGAREALGIEGSARINGGVYEGSQHGGGYMGGSDIKVKNAIFRNIAYTGDCGWDEDADAAMKYYYGAVYCGSSSNNDVNVYFDNCRFESNHPVASGIVAKYSGTEVFLSNCVIDGDFNNDLRVDAGNTIYIGKNVQYDTVLANGTIDTTTYADREFGFETEATTAHAILSVKDERGNWVGIA